jgi:histidinol-phosphate aminotransferase
VRTSSKACGLAGLRIGYLVAAAEEVTDAIATVTVPFGASAVAQAAALAALAARAAHGEVALRCDEVRTERDRLRAALGGLGYRVPPSHGNFLWLDLASDAEQFAAHCGTYGIAVRPFRGEGVPVTVGLPEHNAAFLDAARRFVDGLRAPAQVGRLSG